jgi:hypothetical protein
VRQSRFIGGDLLLLPGVAKAVFEASERDPDVLDRDFIECYTSGIDEYRAIVEATPWANLVHGSGRSKGSASSRTPIWGQSV